MKKFFSKKDYADADMILNQLSVKTNCFDKQGKVMDAEYLVCIDDDITSAYYAADLYYQIHQTYEYYPTILCVGGFGPLSKYTNFHGESEGQKLAQVCEKLGVFPSHLVVLDRGTNTGLNCLDIYAMAAGKSWKMIICLTKRLSLRLKQTFEYLDHQYPERVNASSFARLMALTFYYVPEQKISDMMQVYNCKGLCKGVMLLSEIASIYDRVVRYSGKLQKPLDFAIAPEVKMASERLAQKYPLKINIFCFNGIWQFIWAYYSVMKNKRKIKYEALLAVRNWRRKLREKYRD